VNSTESTLDVTAYRPSLIEAEKWKDVMIARGEFDCLLLRRAEDSWLVYDPGGKMLGESNDVTSQYVAEALETVAVDRALFEQETREFLLNDDLSLIACAEGHAGASAADHSNLSVMCRHMIVEAPEDDLRHVFLVESRRWPCRVAGLFADMSRMSGPTTDVFIDRVKWVKSSWPLVTHHHLTTLADRLAQVRPRYVRELLTACANAAKVSPDVEAAMQTTWTLAGPGYRYRFALRAATVMQEGILYRPTAPETFSDEIVARHAKDLIKEFRAMMP
jgi:hypothetical protein